MNAHAALHSPSRLALADRTVRQSATGRIPRNKGFSVMDKHLKSWVIFLLLSIFLVPVVIYMGGTLLVGPYEGEFGLMGMMGTIYGDAAKLKGSAWVVLLAPLLLALIWFACIRLSNTMVQRYSGN